MKVVEINDNDIYGKVFNGYDIAERFNKEGKFKINQLVIHKFSKAKFVKPLLKNYIGLDYEYVLNKLSNFDLILCGHTHNGMVPDFLAKMFKSNEGIIAPNKKLLPETARGKIEKMVKNKKITIIITGGITKLSLKSSKVLNKLNFIYNISINKIILTKKRGISYE